VESSLVAVVGGSSLLAREIRELLSEMKPAPRVQLISASADGSTTLAAEDEEPIVMAPLSVENLEGAKAVFLAGSQASSRRTHKVATGNHATLIDLSSALEEQPGARLRAPLAESDASNRAKKAEHSAIAIIAHPAAIALANFLGAVQSAAAIRRSIVHVFEPTSERGQQGIEELQQQTVATLSFKKLKTDVFDAQLAFNMLARYGEEANEPLEGIEQRLERHLASLLADRPGIPMPSLRLVQAPVFHGHSFSVWIEFEHDPDLAALKAALDSAGIDVRPDDPPSNAGIAGQSGISAGAIAIDSNHPKAVWFWLVSDNIRMAAENAVAVAKELL
jgi:aspartate-semialdehyde dehydrogenase